MSDHIKAAIHKSGIHPNKILKNIIATIFLLSCTTAMIDGKKYNAVTTINNKIRKHSAIKTSLSVNSLALIFYSVNSFV